MSPTIWSAFTGELNRPELGAPGRLRPCRPSRGGAADARGAHGGRLQGRERQLIGFGIAATAIAIYPFSTVLGQYSLNYRPSSSSGSFQALSMSPCSPCSDGALSHNGWGGF